MEGVGTNKKKVKNRLTENIQYVYFNCYKKNKLMELDSKQDSEWDSIILAILIQSTMSEEGCDQDRPRQVI